ncbi:MAG TPA: DUF4124 domain-containing protein [Casimicrobiaceae bacterium]
MATYLASTFVQAASVSEKMRESGCTGKPVAISDELYKCPTASGTEAYFNVPGRSGGPRGATSVARSSTTPSAFPRVDAETQKSRDEKRRKVLDDELANEQKLLAEAREAYDNGAPPPLPVEKNDAEKYRERIARLRQTVQVHERNVEALRKEIATIR